MILLIVAYVVGWVIATAIIATCMEDEYDLDVAGWLLAVIIGCTWPMMAAVAPVVIAAQILKEAIVARREASQS